MAKSEENHKRVIKGWVYGFACGSVFPFFKRKTDSFPVHVKTLHHKTPIRHLQFRIKLFFFRLELSRIISI